LRFFVSFARNPLALPADIHAFIRQGPPEVHVVKQHVWSRGISGVYDLIVDADNGFTQSAGNGAPEGELVAEGLRLFDYSGESHVQSARGGVGLDNGFDGRRNAAVLAMQPAVARRIGLRPANVVETTGGDQSATESMQPFDAAIGAMRGRRYTDVAYPR